MKVSKRQALIWLAFDAFDAAPLRGTTFSSRVLLFQRFCRVSLFSVVPPGGPSVLFHGDPANHPIFSPLLCICSCQSSSVYHPFTDKHNVLKPARLRHIGPRRHFLLLSWNDSPGRHNSCPFFLNTIGSCGKLWRSFDVPIRNSARL